MTDDHAALRAWAKSTYPTEAATELLIRGFHGRFARPGHPWIVTAAPKRPGHHGPATWINFQAISDGTGALSSGERAFLLIAASIGHNWVLVNLSEEICRLDREHLDLVLAALAHAAGSHQHSGVTFDPDGTPIGFTIKLPSLYPWPKPLDTA